MELVTFNSGDTDYIAKLNSNIATLTDTINGMAVQIGAVSGGDALTVGMFLDTLFNRADAIIGPESYKATKSASTVTIAPGGMYLQSETAVVASFNAVPLSFIGKPSGTQYIVVGVAGMPVLSPTFGPGAIYQVFWTGSAFSGNVEYLVPVFFDTAEASASRKSLALNTVYPTLDARLEAGEALSVQAQSDAESALAVAYENQAALGSVSFRKIGITVDGTVGVKGAIQIDFEGTIVGWSIIADAVGSLTVEVSRRASSEPPAVPQMPDPVTHKISASTPITLSTAQSAARDEAGVSTWARDLEPWDVIQFKVASVTTITRATLYLRVLEQFPSPPEINPLEMLSPLDEIDIEFREGDE